MFCLTYRMTEQNVFIKFVFGNKTVNYTGGQNWKPNCLQRKRNAPKIGSSAGIRAVSVLEG